MKKLKLFSILSILFLTTIASAAPVVNYEPSLVPVFNNRYYLGTSSVASSSLITASTTAKLYWANIFSYLLTASDGTATSSISGTATSTFGAGIAGTLLNITGTTASSSFSNGFSLLNGTIRIASLSGCNGTSLVEADANGILVCGADAGGGAVTVNTGTANRAAYYSAGSTIDSFNGLIMGSDGTGSTTIASNLTVTSIYASSTGRFTGALTLDTALTVPNGGTGVTTLTSGGILFGGGTGVITASAVLANGELLIGDGSGVPTVATLTGTANEITITNGAGTITIDIPDPLIVGKGGTGAATFTSNGVLYGNGTGALSVTGQGAANTVLTANAGAPSFSTSPTIGNLTVTASSTLNRLWVDVQGATTTHLYVTGRFASAFASSTGATSITLDANVYTDRIILEGNTNIILNSTSSNPTDGSRIFRKILQGALGTYTINWASNNQRWADGNNATATIPSGVGRCLWVLFVYEARISVWHNLASTTPPASSCN